MLTPSVVRQVLEGASEEISFLKDFWHV